MIKIKKYNKNTYFNKHGNLKNKTSKQIQKKEKCPNSPKSSQENEFIIKFPTGNFWPS